MKKSVLLFLSVAQLTYASAQIKVADDAYKEQMTASKYVTEPLSIENNFNTYDGTFLQYYYRKNIVGDTLYTNGAKVDCIVVNHNAKSINRKPFNENPIPPGYYRVTGIFIGTDSGGKEIASELYALVDSGYTSNLPSRESLERGFSLGSGMKLSEINTKVQEFQLKGKKCDFVGYGLDCGIYHRLESMDSSCIYYTKIDTERHFLPVRFYNLICNELKGKDVHLTYKRFGGGYKNPSDRKIKDALTGTVIFQKDSLFHCIDVVVNNDNLSTCCVLEGEKSGKFAIKIDRLSESDKSEDNNECMSYYSTVTDKMTIWQPDPYTGSKGELIRDRHFHVDNYGEGISVTNETERWLIKVDDLNAIYAETKRYEALTEVQYRQEAEKQRRERAAREAQRKQELCAQYGNEFGTLIASRKVALGMTPEMCRKAWGTPIQISNMVDATGKYTVWKYNLKTCIYFYNGIVARITN